MNKVWNLLHLSVFLFLLSPAVNFHTYHLPLSPDVDECETDSCTHGCLNTYGSFMCTCDEGFELASDGTTCNGNQRRMGLFRGHIIEVKTNFNFISSSLLVH